MGQWTQNSTRVDCEYGYAPGKETDFLYECLINFRDLDIANSALTMAMFFGSEAMLNPNLDPSRFDNRGISSYPGSVIQKSYMPPAAMIVISVLIVLQITGILALALYASSCPAWTETLDSFAIFRLGAAMADELPLISAVEAKMLVVWMRRRDGLATVVKEWSPRHD